MWMLGTEPGTFARAVSALTALSHISCPIPKINKTKKPKPLSPALSARTFAKVIRQWYKWHGYSCVKSLTPPNMDIM